MSKFTMTLLAAGLSLAFGGAYAGDRADASSQDTPQRATQSNEQGAASGQQAPGVGEAVPPGADADARTTQADEPGPGVRHGSNEGGTNRETPGDLPTAAPGTAENLDIPSTETGAGAQSNDATRQQ